MENNGNHPPTGLVIGLPTRARAVPFEWAICLALQNYPMNLNRMFCPVKGRPVDEARNKIVHFARKNQAKYIFMLDDDVAPPFFAVRRLIYDLEMADDEVMIAGGIYATKTYPAEPVVFRGNSTGAFWKWKRGEVFTYPDLWIGTGCIVIKTELFDKLPVPEMRTVTVKEGDMEIPWWFKTVDLESTEDSPLGHQQTDDSYFCNQVLEVGFRIVADGNVLCVHWDTSTDPPTPYQLPEESYPMKDVIAEGMIAT